MKMRKKPAKPQRGMIELSVSLHIGDPLSAVLSEVDSHGVPYGDWFIDEDWYYDHGESKLLAYVEEPLEQYDKRLKAYNKKLEAYETWCKDNEEGIKKELANREKREVMGQEKEIARLEKKIAKLKKEAAK